MTVSETLRRLLAGLSAAAVAIGAAGCASIPDDGPIGTISVERQDSGVQSQVDPDGPPPGAEPNEIVRGFLAAGAGPASDFEVARSFLTDDSASDWDPMQSVLVLPEGVDFEGLTTEITSDRREVGIEIPTEAVVDSSRVYRESAPRSTVDMRFELRQVNGEWRIASAPDALVLSTANFAGMFQARSLYFLTPDGAHLVPDTRWFLRSQSAPTEVMRELLAGPADYLAGSVVSAIPDGTGLSPRSVVASGGTAAVGLDSAAQGLDERTLGEISAQITATLRELPSVSAVDVTTPSGEVPPPAEEISATVPVDPRPLVLSDGQLRRLDGTRLEEVPGISSIAEGASAPALAIDESAYAYLADSGAELHRIRAATAQDVVVLTGESLVPPSFDRYGGLWTAEAAGEGRIQVISEAGDEATLSVPWLSDRTIRGMRVSRDGTRLAILSETNSGESRLEVVGIVRAPSGQPTGVVSGSPLVVGIAFERIVDIAWSGSIRLAVIASSSEGSEPRPVLIDVGGQHHSLGDIVDGDDIAASSDARSIRLATRSGELYSYTSNTWQKLVDVDADSIAYAG